MLSGGRVVEAGEVMNATLALAEGLGLQKSDMVGGAGGRGWVARRVAATVHAPLEHTAPQRCLIRVPALSLASHCLPTS
jgi:hypothetical protein